MVDSKQLMDAMDDLVKKIQAAPDAKNITEVQSFLAYSFDLMALRRNADPDNSEDIAEFVARTAELVNEHYISFDVYGGEDLRLYLQREFLGHEWALVCKRRSHIEAFNELYAPFLPEENLIETDELDDDIRFKAKYDAVPIPESEQLNVPESHWWWHLA